MRAILQFDTFTDADGVTIPAHVPDFGPGWVATGNVPAVNAILTNRAEMHPAYPGSGVTTRGYNVTTMTVPVGLAMMSYNSQHYITGTGALAAFGLVFRYLDTSNLMVLKWQKSPGVNWLLALMKRQGGVDSYVVSQFGNVYVSAVAGVLIVGDIKVFMDGSSIIVYDSHIDSPLYYSDNFNQAMQAQGLYSEASGLPLGKGATETFFDDWWVYGLAEDRISSIYGRYEMPTKLARNAFSRMWLIENRAGPVNVPSYEGLWKAGRPGWSLGDVTQIYIPSGTEYGRFDVAGKILGERGSPTLATTAHYRADSLSTLLRIARLGCDHDLQVHFGDCKDPQDFNRGWDKIMVLEAARPTEYATTEMGALAPGDQSMVDEEVPWSGEALYEIVPIVYAEQAEAEAVQKIVDIEVCDRISCGECGITSDGCQVVFAVTLTVGGSPGLPAELLYTQNGGDDWYDTVITTLAVNEDPNALDCVGVIVVVISEDSESLHWAPIADILAGTEVWTEEGTGFVAGRGPLAIFSLDPRHTWIVGEGGYVYFTDDPVIGVEVQDAGIATAQDLRAVHALDSLNVVAVGNNNAVVLSRNGGQTWAPLTGPAPGIGLLCVWMRGPDEWFVGAADGNLYYTVDGGTNWVQKEFYQDGAGGVVDIKFSSPTVGWMSHTSAAPHGRILRTIDGGYSWYVTPEGNTALPANDAIGALAQCENVNVIYGGGLADDGTDGIIVKGEGA